MGKTKSRGNGQGTAYKRGNGWEACVVVGWKHSQKEGGKPVPVKRRKSGFSSKRDAISYCSVLLKTPTENRVAPRLFTYWNTYSANDMLKLSASKQTAYRIAWSRLKPIQDYHVDMITVDILRDTVNKACTSYYTARDCKSLLSNLFRIAAADGFANKDLPAFIVLPELVEKEREVFTPEEQTALWKLYESGDRSAALPLLMIYTGMMPGEAQNLKVSNINLTERTITHAGLKTKTRKATPIVLSQSILPVVEDLIANARPSGYVFPHSEDDWYELYYIALSSAGCRRLTPYCCRHTTATALAITENIAPQTIKRVMRWSTTKMLDRYAHPEMSDALSAVDAIKKGDSPTDSPTNS